MRRIVIVLAALAVAVVPAVAGLFGNASFAQRLPLRSPASSASSTATPSDSPSSTSSATPTPSPSESADDHGGYRPRVTSDD